jgi:CrcB protein
LASVITANFPLGTFLISVSGVFAMGYLSVFFNVDWRLRHGTAVNAGVLTGVLCGYTTFSGMQLDAVKLTGTSGRLSAGFYLLLSVALSQVAAWLGGALPPRRLNGDVRCGILLDWCS